MGTRNKLCKFDYILYIIKSIYKFLSFFFAYDLKIFFYFWVFFRCKNNQFLDFCFLAISESAKGLFLFEVFSLASNSYVIPVGCRSHSLGWSDVSAEWIAEQSGRKEWALVGSRFALFLNIRCIFCQNRKSGNFQQWATFERFTFDILLRYFY